MNEIKVNIDYKLIWFLLQNDEQKCKHSKILKSLSHKVILLR